MLKTFYGYNLQLFQIGSSVYPWHAFKAWSNICELRPEAYPRVEHLRELLYDRLRPYSQTLARNKYLSLLRTIVNYERKKFYNFHTIIL